MYSPCDQWNAGPHPRPDFHPPKLSVAKMIGQLKGSSSQRVNEKFVSYNSFAWQAEYGVFSVSEKVLPKIVEYVKNQKKHHLENRLLDSLELDAVSQ
jgi:putative transposase